ncbi:hypothetical protein ACFL1M_01410 [Patescibacteria group bacterium]
MTKEFRRKWNTTEFLDLRRQRNDLKFPERSSEVDEQTYLHAKAQADQASHSSVLRYKGVVPADSEEAKANGRTNPNCIDDSYTNLISRSNEEGNNTAINWTVIEPGE